jgi:hypothetical protein
MEIIRTKAIETRVAFPLITSGGTDYFTGTAWGSLTNATAHIMSWQDSENLISATLTNTPTEIANTGEWFIVLTSAEMNPDSGADDYVLLKFNADEIQEQTALIHLVDYQLRAVFDSNNRINGIAGTKNTLDDLNDITSDTVYDVAVSANEPLATTSQLQSSADAIVAEINENEAKLDITIANQASISADIVTEINENEAKIDTTIANQASISADIVSEIDANEAKIDTTISNQASISADLASSLNDITNNQASISADLKTEIDANEAKLDTTLANQASISADIISEINENEAKLDTAISNQASISADLVTEINVNEAKIDTAIANQALISADVV